MKKILILPVLFSVLFLGGCSGYYSQNQVNGLIQQESVANQAAISGLTQQISNLQNTIDNLAQKTSTTAAQQTIQAPVVSAQKPNLTQLPAPTPSNVSVSKGWTTYKNSANYFTFNYPDNWLLSSLPGNTAELRSLSSSGSLGQGLLGQNEIGVEITQSASNNTQEIKAWCENNIAHFQFASLTTQFSNGHYITVGGSNAYATDYQIKEDTRLSGRQICVAKGNNKFILVAYPLNSILLSDFDKIITSFEFTK